MFWISLVRLMLDHYWINQRYFRSIKSIFRSIENRIDSFLKPLAFHVLNTFSNFSKAILSLFDRSRIQRKFLSFFPLIFCKGFWLLKPIRPFCLSFFIYFHVSCIFFHAFWEILVPMKIWGFCCGMLLNWSLWFDLINLMNWEKLNFLGLETTRIGDFVQLSIFDEIGLLDWLIWSL